MLLPLPAANVSDVLQLNNFPLAVCGMYVCCMRVISVEKVTEATKKVAEAYGVKFVAGTQMEQITRYIPTKFDYEHEILLLSVLQRGCDRRWFLFAAFWRPSSLSFVHVCTWMFYLLYLCIYFRHLSVRMRHNTTDGVVDRFDRGHVRRPVERGGQVKRETWPG